MARLRATPVLINWHSGLPIYASEAFLKTVSDEYGWIGGTDEAGQLRCLLPYTVIRKPGFRIVRFRVETIPMEGELDLLEEKAFLNGVTDYFRSVGMDMIMPASNSALFRTYPDGAVAAPYGTFIKDLTRTEEVLWSELHPKCRQTVRLAIKTGVRIKTGMEHLDVSHDLIQDTLKRSGLRAKSYRDFRSSILALPDSVKIFVAEYAEAVQACMVAHFSEYGAYGWYGGTVLKPPKGAMHYLMWEAICQFQRMGVKRFNFTGARINPESGSKQYGLMTFKTRFGGTLVQGYAWKYSFHPLKFAAYSLATRLLRGGDVVDQEHDKLLIR